MPNNLTYSARQTLVSQIQTRITTLQTAIASAPGSLVYDPNVDAMVPRTIYESTHSQTIAKELAHCQANLARHNAILAKQTPPTTAKPKPQALPPNSVVPKTIVIQKAIATIPVATSQTPEGPEFTFESAHTQTK